MSRRYAANTSVSTDKSRAEIERILQRYGADQFAYGWQVGRAVIQFRANGKYVRFELPIPDKNDPEFLYTPTRGYERTESQAYEMWEQACRQSWRALRMVIYAKLEAVEAGITEFEDEFLAYIVMPNGQTVSAMIRPSIEESYLTGKTMPMLPAGKP